MRWILFWTCQAEVAIRGRVCHPSMRDPLDMGFDFMTPRKITFDQVELESNNQSSSIKKVGSNGKKKMSTAGFNLNLSALKNKKWKSKKNEMASVPDFSPTPIKGMEESRKSS